MISVGVLSLVERSEECCRSWGVVLSQRMVGRLGVGVGVCRRCVDGREKVQAKMGREQRRLARVIKTTPGGGASRDNRALTWW